MIVIQSPSMSKLHSHAAASVPSTATAPEGRIFVEIARVAILGFGSRRTQNPNDEHDTHRHNLTQDTLLHQLFINNLRLFSGSPWFL